MARGFGIGMALAIMFAANPILAQTPVATEKYAVREGFAFAPEAPPRILVFRPEIKVGEQTTAGLFQNNAEWHATATRELSAALIKAGGKRGIEMILHDEADASSPMLAEHRALFRLVVGARLCFADGAPDVVAYPENRAGWARLCQGLGGQGYRPAGNSGGDCPQFRAHPPQQPGGDGSPADHRSAGMQHRSRSG